MTNEQMQTLQADRVEKADGTHEVHVIVPATLTADGEELTIKLGGKRATRAVAVAVQFYGENKFECSLRQTIKAAHAVLNATPWKAHDAWLAKQGREVPVRKTAPGVVLVIK